MKKILLVIAFLLLFLQLTTRIKPVYGVLGCFDPCSCFPQECAADKPPNGGAGTTPAPPQYCSNPNSGCPGGQCWDYCAGACSVCGSSGGNPPGAQCGNFAFDGTTISGNAGNWEGGNDAGIGDYQDSCPNNPCANWPAGNCYVSAPCGYNPNVNLYLHDNTTGQNSSVLGTAAGCWQNKNTCPVQANALTNFSYNLNSVLPTVMPQIVNDGQTHSLELRAGGASNEVICGSFTYPPTGVIQGSKRLMPNNQNAEPAASQTVYLDGSTGQTVNPYAYAGVSATTHTVSVTTPANYSVGYTLCYNDTSCHNNAPTAGSSASVNVPAHGYADLWWHYTCTSSTPAAFSLLTPTDGTTVGNTSQTLTWNPESDFGFQCPGTTNTYKVYIDTVNTFNSANLQTFTTSSTSQAVTLSDQTHYYWKVVADNGTKQTTASALTSPWDFWVKMPKVCGTPSSTLFEDLNQNGCYDSATEKPVSIAGINVSSTPGGNCTITGNNYCCTVPIDAPNSKVTLSASNYSPYSGTTNCSSCGACVLNGCQPTLNPGDNLCVNMGFVVKPWYQADSGSVYSKGDIRSIIPANAQNYTTGAAVNKYFVLNQAGPVLSNAVLDFGTIGRASEPAPVREWKDTSYSIGLNQFKYSFFLNKLANKVNQKLSGNVTLDNGIISDGTHSYSVINNSVWDITGSLTVNNSANLDGLNSVFLVSGGIQITNDIKPASIPFYLAFISGGNITVNPTVLEIHGLYFADGTFSDGVTTDQGLKVVGGVGALTNVNLQRAWTTSYKPAEYFVSDPGLYVNLASTLGLPSYTWSEVAP